MTDAEIFALIEGAKRSAYAAAGDAHVAATTAYAIGMLASTHDNGPAKRAAIEYAAEGADKTASAAEEAASAAERAAKQVSEWVVAGAANPPASDKLVQQCEEAVAGARKAAARARKAAAEVRANAGR